MSDDVTRVIALRHGETDWNIATRIQGQLDIGLNAAGREQARRLGAALATQGLDAIYASDLVRASDTGHAVALEAGLRLQIDAGLRERAFGVFEGLTFAEIEVRYPDEARRWRQRDPAFGPPGGETLTAFYVRAVGAVAALAARHRGEHIAIVAHGGVLDALYRAATRVSLNAPRTWLVGNASINRLLATDAGFVLVGWADDAHLDGVALDELDARA